MTWPEVVLVAGGAYLAVGLIVAIPFVLVGANRIDEAAGGSGWGFRLVIIPGSAALWPVLVARWARAGRPGP